MSNKRRRAAKNNERKKMVTLDFESRSTHQMSNPADFGTWVHQQIEEAIKENGNEPLTNAALNALTLRLSPLTPEKILTENNPGSGFYDRYWLARFYRDDSFATNWRERINPHPGAQTNAMDEPYSATGRDPTKHTLIVGDTHIGMYNSVAEHTAATAKSTEQLRAYAAMVSKAEVLVVMGGDPMYPLTAAERERVRASHDAMMIDKNGDPHWVDYKMRSDVLNRFDYSQMEQRALGHMELDTLRDLTVKTTEDAVYGRGPKKRDWEQRSKKRRK